MEVTTVVCDLCGKPSIRQVTIDVCEKHDETIQNRVPEGHPQSIDRYHASGPEPCPYCGQITGNPQGLAAHIRATHPEKVEEWTSQRASKHEADRVAKLKASGLATGDCPFCGRLFPNSSMRRHIQTVHTSAEFKEWAKDHPESQAVKRQRERRNPT